MEFLFKSFFEEIKNGKIEIYNEFSFQHELGIFLRNNIEDFKIEFERNVSHFGYNKSDFIKKELDISIYKSDILEVAIELKFPRNGQVPEQMFSFIKDLKFLEQLTSHGFKTGYLLVVADDPLFYKGKLGGIYSMFRSKSLITGEICKPTGPKDRFIEISKSYQSNWNTISGNLKYCLLKTTSENIN